MSATEGQFVSNFQDLIGLQEQKLSATYAKDLKEVERFGITLPKLEFPAGFKFSDGKGSEEVGGDKISVTLKSIKPPHKFQVVLETSVDNTVFKLKEDLIESNEQFSGFEPKNFKFLIKGKVLNDSAFVKDISTENVTITVFVSLPTPESAVLSPSPVVQEPEIPAKKEVSELMWSKLEQVLLTEFDDEESKLIIGKFKKGYEL